MPEPTLEGKAAGWAVASGLGRPRTNLYIDKIYIFPQDNTTLKTVRFMGLALVNNQNHIQNLFTLYQIPVSASQISLDLHDHHVVCIRYYPCVKDTTILCVS